MLKISGKIFRKNYKAVKSDMVELVRGKGLLNRGDYSSEKWKNSLGCLFSFKRKRTYRKTHPWTHISSLLRPGN